LVVVLAPVLGTSWVWVVVVVGPVVGLEQHVLVCVRTAVDSQKRTPRAYLVPSVKLA